MHPSSVKPENKVVIYSPQHCPPNSRLLEGIVIFDGDGDGTSAAALWLMDKGGEELFYRLDRARTAKSNI